MTNVTPLKPGAALFDIDAVKAAAAKELLDERVAAAKKALLTQLRIIAAAEAVVTREKLKLADIEAQITEGSI